MGNSSKILILSAALATSLMAADQQSTNASPNIPIKNPGNNVNKLLLEAVNKDSLPDVKAIVQQNAKQIDRSTFVEALSNAATTGKQVILQWFMSEDNLIKPDQDTVNLIFMLAAEGGNLTTVEWFLKNSPRKTDPNGIYRAFSGAAKTGKIAILQYLILNAPKGSISQNAVNKVFIESAEAGDLETVKWFLTLSPIKPDQNTAMQKTIILMFIRAAELSKLSTVEWFLKDSPIKPDQNTVNKVFIDSCASNNLKTLQYLMLNVPTGSISQDTVNQQFIKAAIDCKTATLEVFLKDSPLKPNQDTVNKVFLMLIRNYNEVMLIYLKEQILTTVKWFVERSPIKPDQNAVNKGFITDTRPAILSLLIATGQISQDTVNQQFIKAAEADNKAVVEWFLKDSPIKPDQNTVDMAFSQDAVNQKFIKKAARSHVTRTEWFLTRSPIKPDQNAVDTAFIASAEAGNLETVKWFLEHSPIKPDQNAVNQAYINAFSASKEKNKSTPSSIQLGQTLNIKDKIFLYMTNGDHLKIRPDQATLSKVVSELYMDSIHNK